eukprot:gene19408-22917_t
MAAVVQHRRRHRRCRRWAALGRYTPASTWECSYGATTTAPRHRRSGQRHRVIRKRTEPPTPDSNANANTTTGNAPQLAKTQPVGGGRGRLTSQSTAALVVPASLSSLSYTEEVSAPGQSRHREFLDRVFGDKGNVGRVDDGNAPAYGSAANRLNPIAELM